MLRSSCPVLCLTYTPLHVELRDVLRQLLRSSDYFGSQRALGATFFTLCQFSPRNFQWFNDLGGAGNALLEVVVVTVVLVVVVVVVILVDYCKKRLYNGV